EGALPARLMVGFTFAKISQQVQIVTRSILPKNRLGKDWGRIGKGLDRLDRTLRELDPLLAAEQRQQDQDALVGALPGVEPPKTSERPMGDAHGVTDAEGFAPRKLDQAVALARLDLSDHGVRHARRRRAVHHETDDAGRPAGGVPLKLDQDEGVARKQRRPRLELPAAVDAPLAQAWVVNLEAGQRQEVQRQGGAVRLKLCATPICHRFTPQAEGGGGRGALHPRRRSACSNAAMPVRSAGPFQYRMADESSFATARQRSARQAPRRRK